MENNSILALDVGDRRVGIAIAGGVARLANPVGAVDRQKEDIWDALQKYISDNNVTEIVIGLPRGMEGQESAQTAVVRDFARQFEQHFKLKIHFQDEALTSRRAEEELRARGVGYNKGDVDALAATYILTDFLNESRS